MYLLINSLHRMNLDGTGVETIPAAPAIWFAAQRFAVQSDFICGFMRTGTWTSIV